MADHLVSSAGILMLISASWRHAHIRSTACDSLHCTKQRMSPVHHPAPNARSLVVHHNGLDTSFRDATMRKKVVSQYQLSSVFATTAFPIVP